MSGRLSPIRWLVLLLSLVSTSPGLAQTMPEDLLQDMFAVALKAEYDTAVADAKLTLKRVKAPPPNPDVWDLSPADKNLIWKGEPGLSPVLMTTFTRASYYSGYAPGQSFSAGADLWLVPAPEMKSEVLAANPALALANPKLATQMYLGLPPDPGSGNDSVVSLWVAPASIVRPAMDTRVDVHDLITSFAVNPQVLPAPQAAAVPRDSPGPGVGPQPDFTSWFVARESVIYDTPGGSYPWTGLGYTYNWGAAGVVDGMVGGSEFIVPHGSTVTLKEVSPIASFYAR